MCSHMSITSQDSGDNSRSGRNGLTTWTHTLREEITSGRSDRDVTGVCAYRSSLQPTGMAASGRLRVSLRSGDKDARSADQRSGEIAHMLGTGQCWSRYSGARDGRRAENRLESQRSLPVSFSRVVTVHLGEALSCLSKTRRRRILSGSRRTVKCSKSKAQPIHTTCEDRAALCQLMGTLRICKSTMRTAASSGADERSRTARRSST